MEAILNLAYRKPTVTRKVKEEVYRLTGRKHPYKTIQSWPDGHLKDFDTQATVDLLDITPTSRPSILLYDPDDPPLNRYAIAKRTLEAKQTEFTKMYNELFQAIANLEELRSTVKMAKKELEAMQARFDAMTPPPSDQPDPRPPIREPDEDDEEDEDQEDEDQDNEDQDEDPEP